MTHKDAMRLANEQSARRLDRLSMVPAATTAQRAHFVVAGDRAARQVVRALQVDDEPVEQDPTSPQSPEAIRALREQCRQRDAG